MAATLPYAYRTYEPLRSAGTLDLSGTRCEVADCREASGGAPLVLTSTEVERGAIFLERDSHGVVVLVFLRILIALGRCDLCKIRVRLLPSDVLPRKQYTTSVIEEALVRYCGTREAPFPQSLRHVAYSFLGDSPRTPSHVTVHGWSEGLGAFASGRRIGELPGAVPVSWLLRVTEMPPLRPQLEAARLAATPVAVPAIRYEPPRRTEDGKVDPEDARKSEARKERLEKLFEFLGYLLVVMSGNPADGRMSHWTRLVLGSGQSLPWQFRFRSVLGCTGLEHSVSRGSQDCRCRQRKERHRWQNRGRSPPGGTNR
jgi:hypothetical protein